MKYFALITIILSFSCKNKHMEKCDKSYSIQVWNINASRAFVNLYAISEDSISITFLGGVVGDTERVLYGKALSQEERLDLCDWLGSIDIDTLKTEYINKAVEDGNQKKVEIILGSKTKTIYVSNFYQKDLGELFNVINMIVKDERYKIRYQSNYTGSVLIRGK